MEAMSLYCGLAQRGASKSSPQKFLVALGLLMAAGVAIFSGCGGAVSSTNSTPPPATPTITSFTPAGGPTGTSITVTGTNLTGATSVSIGGVAATTFSVVSATSLTATVAIGA